MNDLIETACHDACQAMARGCAKAVTTGRQSDLQGALAVALDALPADEIAAAIALLERHGYTVTPPGGHHG